VSNVSSDALSTIPCAKETVVDDGPVQPSNASSSPCPATSTTAPAPSPSLGNHQASATQPAPEKPMHVKKYKTVSEGMNTGKFSDEEVARFRQGLELYGRDWPKVLIHV
jgi:hypothetical protein